VLQDPLFLLRLHIWVLQWGVLELAVGLSSQLSCLPLLQAYGLRLSSNPPHCSPGAVCGQHQVLECMTSPQTWALMGHQARSCIPDCHGQSMQPPRVLTQKSPASVTISSQEAGADGNQERGPVILQENLTLPEQRQLPLSWGQVVLRD
jgi:hypothetical protein